MAMNELKVVFWCLCVAIVFENFVRAEHDARDLNKTLRVNISRAVTLYVADDGARVTLRMSSLLKGERRLSKSYGTHPRIL